MLVCLHRDNELLECAFFSDQVDGKFGPKQLGFDLGPGRRRPKE
jgi:hypothetical protein